MSSPVPDFAAAQANLVRTRAASEAARLTAAQAAERQKAARASLDTFARSFDPIDDASAAERQRLLGVAREADAQAAAALADAQRADAAAVEALGTFAEFSDPRRNVERLSDHSPFALLPVRIETRFVELGSDREAAPRHQLWVRIYPDDCWIDTFEETLSTTELANTQRYWRSIWRAGGVEADERAAWRALVAAHGSGRAGYLVDTYQPTNIAEVPRQGEPIFGPDPPTKQDPWSQAPKIRRFPERFVVLGFVGTTKVLESIGNVVTVPLDVGPNPSADADHTIHPGDDGELFVPDELKWMVDFEAALAAGMGLAIDVTPAQAESGFDRLLVVGLQLGATDADGRTALEELLRHHAASRSALEVLPVGTPTNNTTGVPAANAALDDADKSFDDRRDAPLFTLTSEPMLKRDGQWLAESLGVDPAVFANVHGAGGADQLQARAMQRALWPATLGYWMDKMLAPVFDDAAVESTRSFFTQYVSGRGAVPAIRIGDQPYGILPTTAFSRIRWLDPPIILLASRSAPDRDYLARLLGLLRTIQADWSALSANVSFVGKPGDPHQTLLDIIGLNPDSVEFHHRYAESVLELFNMANLSGAGPSFSQALQAIAFQAAGLGVLQRLGYTGQQLPQILQLAFVNEAGFIEKIVDDRPLSETSPIRAYTDEGRNYIQWLIDGATNSFDDIVAERGFIDDASPRTLLYLFLRHAMMLGYYDTSYRLHRTAGFLSAAELAAFKPEPTFVHVGETQAASESRFAPLYKTESRITSSPSVLVSDFITRNLNLGDALDLADQIEALRQLVDAPTAQLERAFAEHVDLCSYRLDAWLLAFVNLQLQQMRAPVPGNEGNGQSARTGVYLGAYAWVEDLRPAPPRGSPITLPPDLEPAFGKGAPIFSDARNGGYIHAPSLPQARTAAVLRGGHLANATPANPETLAVDLSSDRVRLALSLLEGIRNGQSLGALLGYRFERDLHDRHGFAEVDQFIFPLRKAFPLVGDSLSTTKTQPQVAIDAIEARNVLDGRKLVTHIRATGNATYPFGLDGLRAGDASQTAAISVAADALLDVYDAVADLALAEGVHQAVQGNYDRVGGTLDAYTSGNFPPQPEVVQTPPVGIGLTHKVAVHFQPGLTPPANATPRAQAEPAIDAWLEQVLPPLAGIGCTVTWTDPIDGSPQQLPVTFADLRLRPIDLLALVNPDDVQAMTELDDRVLQFTIATAAPRPDADLRIGYLTPPAGSLSVFEATALVRNLKTLVARSRPLRATDIRLQIAATTQQDDDVFVDRARVATPKAHLDTLGGDVVSFLGTLGPLVADPVANRAAIVGGIDGFASEAVSLLERAARFNLPLLGWGFIFDGRHAFFADLLAQVRDLVTRWDAKLAEFDARLVAYDALPPTTSDNDRLKALHTAELVISTAIEQLPTATLRPALDTKRTIFLQRRDDFAAILTTAGTPVATVLASVESLLPVSDFDTQPFDVTAFSARAVILAEDIARVLTGHAAEVEKRRDAAQTQLDVHDAAGTASARVAALQAGARALFGQDFVLVAEFGLDTTQADELANAVAASDSLLNFLRSTAGVDFPVDEWLYGVARVRPMLHTWETTVMLAGAFDRPELPLVPAQLPFAANASWLAMQFPPDAAPDSDRLLYTAYYATPFDKTARQCGLLLDEWSEVIPATTRDTGIAFNFDRPDNEAPQSILLVTPATANGSWQWEDLVGALNETLDLAKIRGVEPVQVDNTPYTRFVPATIMAATLYNISIGTLLAAANDAVRLVESPNAQ